LVKLLETELDLNEKGRMLDVTVYEKHLDGKIDNQPN
jgi:hypothetical protein